MSIPRVLVIAGSDSGGGAGIQADIKTITMLGGHAMTAITAITAQNTLGVEAVQVLSPEMVIAQARAVLDDIGADAIKLGMLGSAETALVVADLIAPLGLPIIFDPVMVATSGAVLADAATIAAFDRLARLAAVTTPNLPEFAVLGGGAAPAAYVARIGRPLLLKGGHGAGERLVDRLFEPGRDERRWEDARIDTRHTHGTGCTLASAIALGLARREPLEAAIGTARDYVRRAILSAPGLGAGDGPMGVGIP